MRNNYAPSYLELLREWISGQRPSALPSHCLVAGAALLAIFVIREGAFADRGIYLTFAGLAMLLFPLARKVPRPLLAAATALVLLSATAFLPVSILGAGGMEVRSGLAGLMEMGLPLSVTPTPGLTLYTVAMLAVTCAIALYLLAQSLDAFGMMAMLCIAAAAIGFYGLLAIVDANTAWNYPIHPQFPKFGYFPSRNHTSLLLVLGGMCACGLITLGLRRDDKGLHFLAWPVLGICAFGLLVESEARSGVLLMGLGGILLLLGLGRKYVSLPLLITALAVVFIGGGVFLASNSRALIRMQETWMRVFSGPITEDEVADDGSTTPAMELRPLVYQDTAVMIWEAPLTGHGLGTFPYVFPRFQQLSITKFHPEHPDSDYLMLAAEAGLPALLATLVLAGLLVARARHLRLSVDWPSRWPLLVAGLLALIQAIFDVPLHQAALGWLVLSILCAGLHYRVSQDSLRAGRLEQGIFRALGALVCVMGLWHLASGALPLQHRPPPAELADRRVEVRALREAGRDQEAHDLARESSTRYPVDPVFWYERGLLIAREPVVDHHRLHRALNVEQALRGASLELYVRQAALWQPIDPEQAGKLRLKAISLSREALRSKWERKVFFEDMLIASVASPITYGQLAEPARETAERLFAFLKHAPESFGEAALTITAAPREQALLHTLTLEERREIAQLWRRLSDPAVFRDYIRANPDWERDAWQILAEDLAAEKAWREAVELSFRHLDLHGDLGKELDRREPSAEVLKLTRYHRHDNQVALRLTLEQLREAREAPPDAWSISAVYASNQGDWEEAWRYIRHYWDLAGSRSQG